MPIREEMAEVLRWLGNPTPGRICYCSGEPVVHPNPAGCRLGIRYQHIAYSMIVDLQEVSKQIQEHPL